jgi:uncharacterized protein YaiE (UPF0345 family)
MGLLPLCEISFDLLPDPDGSFGVLEGTYRREGREWEVMTFVRDDVARWRYRKTKWQSGGTGCTFRVPRAEKIDSRFVERCLGRVFGPHEWIRTHGPDSMRLR